MSPQSVRQSAQWYAQDAHVTGVLRSGSEWSSRTSRRYWPPCADPVPVSGVWAKVPEEAGEPPSCKASIKRALEAGYWQSEGKTPHATVYSAILREMQKKGYDARFRKVERGKLALAK